ncbi:MAG TPA: NAD-dependent deacylase [Patescibacteria group bacterium]|nr:NAD-dependent deacylase [Patescibacteria group bacterium]
MNIPNELIDTLLKAEKVAVLTGAGISAESGIATFRDPDGLWAKFNPAELASMDGFLKNPERVWQWYQYRRQVIDKAKPNPGHTALAAMQYIFKDFTLITQNVDRLHQSAGSTDVVELHGNIIDNHCSRCQKPFEEEINIEAEEIPRCTYCGGMIRPSVVWFGEMLPEDAIFKAEDAALECDVFLTVGTSAEVYPAAMLPVAAKRAGAFLVEINPDFTHVSGIANVCVHEASGVALPQIVRLLKEQKNL